MSDQVQEKTLPLEPQPVLEVMDASAIEAINRAEIDVAIATAKRYPRDIAAALKTCKELALRNPQVAAKCNYALPRGGKNLIGPSIHFARIVKYAWGHLNSGSQVIWATREFARLLGVCHDLQTNNREANIMDWPVQAPHVTSDERWRDQINLAKRAGSAIAERNAIFGCVPMVLFDDVLEEAKLLAIGRGKSFIESRDNAIRQCKELKITQPMIYRALDIGGLESITTDHLIWLHAALQSIREQASTVEELFGPDTAPVRARAPKSGVLDQKPKPDEASSGKAPDSPTADTKPSAFGKEKEEPPSATADQKPKTLKKTAGSKADQLEALLADHDIKWTDFSAWISSLTGLVAPAAAKDLPANILADCLANFSANREAFEDWLARVKTEGDA